MRRNPTWTGRMRARRARGQRGIVLIEAVLVTPIFLMLIMAIAEAGLYMRSDLAVASTVRAGSRAASAAGAEETADLFTVYNIAKESAAIKRSSIEYIVIYKATGFGAGPTEELEDGVPAGCLNGHAVTGQCNVYHASDFALAEIEMAERSRAGQANEPPDDSKVFFTCKTGSPDRFWCPKDRVNSHSGNGGHGPDYVGVYMKIQHDWLTGMFVSESDITDQSVIKIEPRRL